jgi:hypothetical protein
MNHTRIGIITLAAVAVMLIAAASVIPIIQQQVYARSLRHFNFEHGSRHSNQLTLCYRSEECNQSNIGIQQSGKDNDAFGFADQSHRQQCCNIQPLIIVPRP